jgi:7-carboxy-7-deazaguanine synthase
MTLQEIESEVSRLAMPTVLVTGGEPLLQPATPDLLSMLAAATDRAVMLESNGSRLLPAYYRSWKTILDVKCPSSGEGTSFCFDNLTLLQPADELKFVISDENDFQWAQNLLQQYGFFQNHNITILFSPNVEQLSPVHLAEWLLATPHEIRLNVQLHKSLGLP